MINIKKKTRIIITGTILILLFGCTIISKNQSDKYISTSVNMENEKIEWGIKRTGNHQQPDLGSKNKQLIDKYNGIAMGNQEEKNIYLTFDLGYEAGYTSKILDDLKEKNVKGTFFITAHYLNTASDLVERMINEGHIVGNHTPKFLMSGNLNIIKI